MRKHIYRLCAVVIVLTNLLMATFLNTGEEIISNFLVILLTFFFFPLFSWATTVQKASQLRLESVSLLVLATLSLLRLVNRLMMVPIFINVAVVVLVIILGTLNALMALKNFRKNLKK